MKLYYIFYKIYLYFILLPALLPIWQDAAPAAGSVQVPVPGTADLVANQFLSALPKLTKASIKL